MRCCLVYAKGPPPVMCFIAFWLVGLWAAVAIATADPQIAASLHSQVGEGNPSDLAALSLSEEQQLLVDDDDCALSSVGDAHDACAVSAVQLRGRVIVASKSAYRAPMGRQATPGVVSTHSVDTVALSNKMSSRMVENLHAKLPTTRTNVRQVQAQGLPRPEGQQHGHGPDFFSTKILTHPWFKSVTQLLQATVKRAHVEATSVQSSIHNKGSVVPACIMAFVLSLTLLSFGACLACLSMRPKVSSRSRSRSGELPSGVSASQASGDEVTVGGRPPHPLVPFARQQVQQAREKAERVAAERSSARQQQQGCC